MKAVDLLQSRFLLRLQENRALRLVALALSGCLFACALHLAWLAFTSPLELEMREGSVWIHVLAKRAGVDIYDSTRVAFVNMNHGPLDPIFKAWISRCLPALPGHMVTRVFVLLAPVFLFAAAYKISRGHLAAALLAAGGLFLFFCHLSVLTLVGRSDATAICELAICGVLTHELLVTSPQRWANRSALLLQLGLGAASSAVFLTTSRYLPIAAALQLVVFVAQLPHGDDQAHLLGSRRMRLAALTRNVLLSAGLYLAGFAAVWVATLVFELHGDLQSYYRHFFGFFLPKSGWGTFQGAYSFHLVPSELGEIRPEGLLFCLFVLAGLSRLRRRPGQLVAWLMMLVGLWVSVAYGFFKNRAGGGLHYFFEIFVFAWIFTLHAFCRRGRWGALTQILLVGVVALVLPWQGLIAQRKTLLTIRAGGRTFLAQVATVTGGRPVFGEETHLFKKAYAGEVVDTGDTAAAIAGSGYFGPAFGRTFETYARNLVSNPPKFVIAGVLDEASLAGVMTPTLHALLRQRYSVRLVARGISLYNGSAQVLLERRD